MQRQPKTVYFQHFEQLGLYMVYDLQDVRVCRAVTKRMVYHDDTFEAAKRQLEQAGFRVELATQALERTVRIANYQPRVRRHEEVPVTPSFF